MKMRNKDLNFINFKFFWVTLGNIVATFTLTREFVELLKKCKIINGHVWTISIVLSIIIGSFISMIYNVHCYIEKVQELESKFEQLKDEYNKNITILETMQQQINGLKNDNNIIETKYNNLLKEYNNIPLINESAIKLLELAVTNSSIEEVKCLKKVIELLDFRNINSVKRKEEK